MKRLFIIFAIFIVGSFSVYGQTYTPMSYDDYSAPLRDYQRAFNRAANQIQSIESTIMGALANDIDEELRSQLNYDYKRLNSISQKLNRNGLYADVWTEISNVRSSVNSHINQYNNRVAAERRRQAQELERQRQAELERQKELERQAEEQKKAGWSGTGFALNQGHIVTNYHVVENAQTILVKGVKGDFNIELRAKVVATDKVNDIAIIKIDDTRFNGFGAIPYKIKRGMADVGESVWALGYPMIGMMGEEIKFTDGKISAKTGLQGDISTYQVSVPLQPGNSGGPLFDNNGYIVGINSSGLNKLYSEQTIQAENVNYSIKTSYLYNLIESALSASVLPQGTAMQGQQLTQKIKLAQKFIFIILCSEEPNFHADKQQRNEAEKKDEKIITSTPPSEDNSPKSQNIISVDKPKCVSTSTGGLKIQKVMVTSTNTILVCTWHNNNQAGCSIDKNAYLKIPSNMRRFKLLKANGITFSPQVTEVMNGTIHHFTLYFEPIPYDTEKFDFIENDKSIWNTFDIIIK